MRHIEKVTVNEDKAKPKNSTRLESALDKMNHKQYLETVKEYRQRSGHSINYYDGGYMTPGQPHMNKPVQKGSLAKDKMNNLLAKSDKGNRSGKRRNTVTMANDI